MVEALLFGAPVVARECTGGVAADLLPENVRRWVRYVGDDNDVRSVLMDASFWVASPARLLWTDLASRGAATDYAAKRLAALFDT